MAKYVSGVKYAGAEASYSIGYVDPLAQSFFVDKPLVVTKVALYFYSKDETLPMRVQIRKMVNGYPSSEIIPFSETFVYPSAITASDDGSVATNISFSAPVYLDIGEYALVLLSDSIKYNVWISQIGENDVITNALISEQPFVGVLFKSQNASTWEANQYQDLKFILYRAVFDTSATATVEFTVPELTYKNLYIDPFEIYPGSNVMRVYHPYHGQNAGSYIRLSGFSTEANGCVSNIVPAYASFYGTALNQVDTVPFQIGQTTLNSYTITLQNTANSFVTSTIRTGGKNIVASEDFRYDSYYPAISTTSPPGTSISHKIKTTSALTYGIDSAFTTIDVADYDFISAKTLPSRINKSVSMSNAAGFIHRVDLSTTTDYLSPVIDTKRASGVFARNLLNNPSYDSENKSNANDVITITPTDGTGIKLTQTLGVNGYGIITFTKTSDIANAAFLTKGAYLNLTSNVSSQGGQFRIIDITDSSTNVAVYNLSSSNVTSTISAGFGITYGRNFIAEEAAYDGSVVSKYITREVALANPCTAFKFYVDTVKPTDTNIKFYYKISEVGDTINLKDKEYTEITGVTIPTSVGGEYYEVEKLLENLPQFDALVFKIVFLGDTVNTNLSQVPKCKNLRVIALA